MGYSAKILADSVHEITGQRLTTMEITFPRIVLAEFNTHRVFSRNSASSRAIPVAKMIEKVKTDPFIPVYWGKNQKGMQATEEFSESERVGLEAQWLRARDQAVFAAESLMETGVHKQITNRLLEPWLWHTVICSATEWENFYAQRCHKDAQPEIRAIAVMMRELRFKSQPEPMVGAWHLPLVPDEVELIKEGYGPGDIARISCARCARVSYLTHGGVRDPKEDLALADRLQASGHMSPFEHAAYACSGFTINGGNFEGGWRQYRKTLPNEAVFLGTR